MAISAAMAAFYQESDSHFEIIEQSLLILDKESGNMDLINELFRAVHSLKGNAGIVGLLDMHAIATEMETLLDSVRKAGIRVTREQRDKLFECLDKLKLLFEKLKTSNGEEKGGEAGSPATAPEPKQDVAHAAPPGDAVHEHEEDGEHGEREHEHEHEEEHLAEEKGKSQAAAEGHQKAMHGKRSFLTFALGSEEYGVSIISVKEIILHRHITRVPNAKGFVTGIMNLRGMVIPVIDARRKLGFATDEGARENIVIIEDEGMITGVLVDRVKDIVAMEEADIISGERALGNMKSDFIEGIGKMDKKTIMLLNVKTFCNAKEKYY